MKLQVPFVQLPLSFDANALSAEIAALGEAAWRPHPQGFAGNSAVPLISAYGDPGSDAVRGPMRPTPQLDQCPYLRQVLGTFGAVLGRTRLMRLQGQGEVTAHVDIDYYWREHVRIHVPIQTQPEVTFYCAEQTTHMAAGECWIFDTWRIHRVVNSAERQRVHLVADTVGGPGFWELVGSARALGMARPDWRPRHIAPNPGLRPELRFESVNLPTVMTPWELREHMNFVIEEAVPHAQLNIAQHIAGHFGRHWQALWACYGESRDGWPEYRAAVEWFTQELTNACSGVVLRNNVPLVRAMVRLVAAVAIAEDDAASLADERSAPAAMMG